MHGPVLPIYGFGAIIALFVTIPVRDHYVMMYIVGALSATLLEYVTGVVMEALFKVRYWDYSNQKFQFQGHICLSSTIAWGFFVIFLVQVIHPPIEQFFLKVENLWGGYPEEILSFGITIYFAADLAVSMKEAFELRDLLIYIEKAKAEAEHITEHIKERVDEKIAILDEEIIQKKEELHEMKVEFEGKMSYHKEQILKRDFRMIRRFLSAHPTAHSDKFKNAMEEIKTFLNRE